jgi:hypothetical protein
VTVNAREADTAAKWQQFAMSIVVDLLVMVRFVASHQRQPSSRDNRLPLI